LWFVCQAVPNRQHPPFEKRRAVGQIEMRGLLGLLSFLPPQSDRMGQRHQGEGAKADQESVLRDVLKNDKKPNYR
jgi:hypothetical protein